MKKRLAIIMVCIVIITSISCVSMTSLAATAQYGFPIDLNGESTGYDSIIYKDTHYVPMRPIFEKLGAAVFYRSRDRQVMALSRDGDTITHIVGSNIISISGMQKSFACPSVLVENQTYVPIEMVAVVFGTDAVSYDYQHLNIQKTMFTNEYHKVIKDVLDVCRSSNFYPERFQRYIYYHLKTPAYTMQEVLFRVNLGLDYQFYENMSVIANPYELLVLVNKYNKLPANFQQYNLVNMDKAYTVNDGKTYLLAGVAYEKYVQMADAAKIEGLNMKVLSAHRTEDYQKKLYDDSVSSSGKVYADNYSARPGHSEHQTGLAVDISSTNATFENTEEFRWLQKHAHEYGFIMRYPKGKEWITGYAYEPWHYRYVGVEAATIIYQEGITYEEYYAKYVSVNEFR